MITLQNVAKRYGTGAEVLHDVSLALEPGGFYFLTGPKGAGKTTLLKIIYLAEPPSHGVVRLFDTETGNSDRAARAMLRRRIGIVFENFRLVDALSIGENVALPLRIAGAPPPEIRERVAALLGWLGLADYVERSPTALSGSERQRVAIARAIVTQPDLLIADEPTGFVDHEDGSLLVRVFERVNERGTTVLIATHDAAFAGQFDHRRFHLEQGSLQSVATDPQ